MVLLLLKESKENKEFFFGCTFKISVMAKQILSFLWFLRAILLLDFIGHREGN